MQKDPLMSGHKSAHAIAGDQDLGQWQSWLQVKAAGRVLAERQVVCWRASLPVTSV